MASHNKYESRQSAYRIGHSSETTLTRFHNDIACKMERCPRVILILLDISPAFDTIYHRTQPDDIKTTGGMCCTALDWFESYHMTNGPNAWSSMTRPLDPWPPCDFRDPPPSRFANRASGLHKYIRCPSATLYANTTCPLIYTQTWHVLWYIRKQDMPFDIYADNMKLYVSFKIQDSSDLVNAVPKIEICVSE